MAWNLHPCEANAPRRHRVGRTSRAHAAQVLSRVRVHVNDEGLSAVANRRCHALQRRRVEDGAAQLVEVVARRTRALIAVARGPVNAYVIDGAQRVLLGHEHGHGVDAEGIGVDAGQVLDAAESGLLPDADRVVLILQMVVVGRQEVEGRESAGQARVPLEATVGRTK